MGTTLRTIDAASAISITNDTLTIPNHGLVTGDPLTYLGSTGSHPTIAAVSTGSFINCCGSTSSLEQRNHSKRHIPT